MIFRLLISVLLQVFYHWMFKFLKPEDVLHTRQVCLPVCLSPQQLLLLLLLFCCTLSPHPPTLHLAARPQPLLMSLLLAAAVFLERVLHVSVATRLMTSASVPPPPSAAAAHWCVFTLVCLGVSPTHPFCCVCVRRINYPQPSDPLRTRSRARSRLGQGTAAKLLQGDSSSINEWTL